VRAEADVVADVMSREVGDALFLEVVPHRLVDVTDRDARAERVDGDGLGLAHQVEVVFLLLGGVADEHRPFEFGHVAVDGRRRAGDDDVAVFQSAVGGVAMGQTRLLAADEARSDGAVAAGSRHVAVAERVEHRAGGLQRGALADGHGMRTDFGAVGEIAVAEIRPACGFPEQVHLRVGFRPAQAVDPRLRLHLDELGKRRPLVSHRPRRALGVGGDTVGVQVVYHARGGFDGVAAGVIEVVVHVVDAVVALDAFDFQARHGRGDAALGRGQDDRPFGLDVVEACEVFDARRAEPDARVGVGFGEAVADGREARRVLAFRKASRHTDDHDRCWQKRSCAGSVERDDSGRGLAIHAPGRECN